MEEVMLNVRVPEELRRKLKAKAAHEGTSVQALVTAAIEKLVADEEANRNGR